MKIDSYWASFFDPNQPNTKFLLIIENEQTPQGVVPPAILAKLGALQWHASHDIQLGEKRIALNADEAINSIKRDGYYVAGVTIKTEISTSF